MIQNIYAAERHNVWSIVKFSVGKNSTGVKFSLLVVADAPELAKP